MKIYISTKMKNFTLSIGRGDGLYRYRRTNTFLFTWINHELSKLKQKDDVLIKRSILYYDLNDLCKRKSLGPRQRFRDLETKVETPPPRHERLGLVIGSGLLRSSKPSWVLGRVSSIEGLDSPSSLSVLSSNLERDLSSTVVVSKKSGSKRS